MDKQRRFWLWFDFIGCILNALLYLVWHDGFFLFAAAMYGFGYLLWYLIVPSSNK